VVSEVVVLAVLVFEDGVTTAGGGFGDCDVVVFSCQWLIQMDRKNHVLQLEAAAAAAA
jgi:hypothetical protein